MAAAPPTSDPLAKLEVVARIRKREKEQRRIVRQIVCALRRAGASWRAIGERLLWLAGDRDFGDPKAQQRLGDAMKHRLCSCVARRAARRPSRKVVKVVEFP